MIRRIGTLGLVVLLTMLPVTAWAYWSATSVIGGSGAAAAASVNQGPTPSASASAQAVTLSWSASTLSNGQAVSGYLIRRYDATTLAAQTVLTACNGTVTSTSCIENGVPGGSWTYTVTPLIGANWRGAESAKSSAVTVTPPDTTAPTNAVTLSSVSGGAFLTGSTLYYRGAAAGSLRLTNAVSDSGSGPASSATAALGGTTTGWSHTPSTVSTPAAGPYVSNPFAWVAATTSPPTEAVTARDVAGNTATTSLSFVDDSTAPSAGTISYADGVASGRSVSVSFATGTDTGSGLASRRLQRAVAALTNGTCGTFGAFRDIATSDPASPYADNSLDSGCYQYRYVVTDRVGNQQLATSANVVKIGYAGTVNATPGLLSHWRLGEGAATLDSSDSFTGASGALVTSRPGEIGATWANHVGSTNLEQIGADNRAFRNGAGFTRIYTTATPASADYSVEADLFVRSNLTGEMAGVVGRLDPNSNSFYMARWEVADTSWNIVKVVNGTLTYPNFVATQPALVPDRTYRVRLEMVGTLLRLYVNGVLTVTATDTSITAAGKAGIMDGNSATSVTKSASTGLHFDNFQVTPASYPRAADSKGTNTGDYENGPVLGAAGALAGDADTAARFDGLNDHVQVTNSTNLPTGAGVRSVEAWFKTTSSARQVLFAYGTPAETQGFALWLNQGGTAMTSWGFGEANGHNKVFTLPAAVNDGAWHHVVHTYDGTSLRIYIDGVALPAQPATRNTVLDSYGFSIGALVNPSTTNFGGFFNGSIDEVSFYTTVLDQATVTDHYQLGTTAADVTGPTGGSVDAGGLVGTGARYSTSTTLNILVDAGTDPSGVATTGAQLRRATASLSSGNGACGTFGSYFLVSGGADPASPKSDVVADQACYRYEYVVLDTVGNPTTYTSGIIKVDTTAPAAPSLSFSAFTNTFASGTTVYYRSGAATGSFLATASATDSASGITNYTFPRLGTGWTETAGAQSVTYAWSGAPAAPGTKNVTATNSAGSVSAGAPFTPTADDAAPGAGTVSYANGGTSSTSVSVSFTTGSDNGSGVATRLLQRASAPLTESTCGTFSAFATVSGGTNPTSPFSDTTTRGTCYQYRYVVADRVGNEHVATSGSVVKVYPTYLGSVSATAGLVNHYRLGEATTSSDSFAGAAGTSLQNRSGEIGATWTSYVGGTANAALTGAGRLRKAGDASKGAIYYASGTPTSADYTVEADVFVASNLTNDIAGVIGRVDPASTSGTYYYARYEQANQAWNLYKVVAGTYTLLGQSPTQTLATGATYRLSLDLTGSSIRLLVDGVQRVSVVDTAITGAGRGGVALGFHATATTTTNDSTGMHLDNFRITPPLVDVKGANNGDYLSGPTLGMAGAIAGDASTAAEFDGVNDFATVGRQIADDFSIEFWFKSTQGIGTGTQWWQGAGLVDAEVPGPANDFGVSLRSDGRILAGVGNPDTSIMSSSGGHNDGAWHHVVLTRTRASGVLTLYVDGVAVGSATGSTASLTSSASLSFGRIQAANNSFYQGLLDEIATYSTPLTAGTIAAHHGAGR